MGDGDFAGALCIQHGSLLTRVIHFQTGDHKGDMVRPFIPLRLLVGKEIGALASVTGLETVTRSAGRVVARRRDSLVFLEPADIWAFQASGRLTFVHSAHGRFDLNSSLVDIEETFCRPLTRVHRNWLVDLAHVRSFDRDVGQATLFVGNGLGDGSQGICVPVSGDRAHAVREALLANATGLRPIRAANESGGDEGSS